VTNRTRTWPSSATSTTERARWSDAGSVPEHVIEQHREEAEEKGKGGFEFAYVMDNLAEERERGVTIDIAHQEFDTDEYYFTIVDCPGHRDFVKNMITGASQADNAVLVVAADDGVAPQTREHVFLARTLGINELIIGINKMDLVDYGEDSYKQVREEVTKLLKQVQFNPDDAKYIPISAFEGDNVAETSDNTDWYDGETLLEALNALPVPEPPTEAPDPGRLHHLRHRNGPGRPRRDRDDRSGEQRLLPALRRRRRGQDRRDAPRGSAERRPRRQRRVQRPRHRQGRHPSRRRLWARG
jgi:small GTP-binding protein